MPDIPLPKPQKPVNSASGAVVPGSNSAPQSPAKTQSPLPPTSNSGVSGQVTTPPPSALVRPPVSNVLTSTPPLGSAPVTAAQPTAGPAISSIPKATASTPSPTTPSPVLSNSIQANPGLPQANPGNPLPKQPGLPGANPLTSNSTAPSTPGNQQAPAQPGVQKNTGSPQPTLTPAKAVQSPIARLSSSPFKFLPFILIGFALLAGAVFAISRFLGGNTSTPVTTTQTGNQSGAPATNTGSAVSGSQVTLTYWGLWEQSETLQSVFDTFESQNPNIKIEYVPQTHVDYRERLQTAIASGAGPDIFRFHASWTPMLSQELAPIPSSIMSVNEFQETFFPVAARQLQSGGQLVGIPLMYDGLGLYINTEMFRQAALSEPTTWAELKSAASRLTIRGSGGEIERAGLAIGNASNVEHFSDIIALLMLQNGATITDPSSKEAIDALTFYTNFYKSDKVWSDKLPTSTVAFARGEVAMMFAPSWRVHEIRTMNPNFTDFKVIPTPSLGGQQITWASYWAEGVNSKSTAAKRDAAWKLLKYMSSAGVMKQMYSDQSQNRLFGQLYSRKDLAQEMISSSDSVVQNYVAPFLEGAATAQGGFMSSYTHDRGLNDQINRYYADAVNAILGGSTADKVVGTVSQGVQQVLRQYTSSSAQ